MKRDDLSIQVNEPHDLSLLAARERTDMRKPAALDAATRRRMQRQRQKNTRPELLLRAELHRRGLRFFVDRAPLRDMRGRADLVFPRSRVAVYVDGCFWHGCPTHGTWPTNNSAWWRTKINGNRARDTDTDRRLREAGWVSVRVWEHEVASEAAERVIAAIAAR